ncbi:Methylosome subunit pICln [Trichinella britovi]|uniref:Methylosome subunit pICln n=1 Tax=Trichinella britovi TaxID=45882 RepID=A0A0V1CBL7_TRIBR|nr:Methylosome subunit pICln [Trichinella britovi]
MWCGVKFNNRNMKGNLYLMAGLQQISLPLNDDVTYKEDSVLAYVNKDFCGTGTLFICCNGIIWANENKLGFELPYSTIAMHAICRDLSVVPHESLYIFQDFSKDDSQCLNEQHFNIDVLVTDSKDEVANENGEDGENNEQMDATNSVYYHFAPSSPESLNTIFQMITKVQSEECFDDFEGSIKYSLDKGVFSVHFVHSWRELPKLVAQPEADELLSCHTLLETNVLQPLPQFLSIQSMYHAKRTTALLLNKRTCKNSPLKRNDTCRAASDPIAKVTQK